MARKNKKVKDEVVKLTKEEQMKVIMEKGFKKTITRKHFIEVHEVKPINKSKTKTKLVKQDS